MHLDVWGVCMSIIYVYSTVYMFCKIILRTWEGQFIALLSSKSECSYFPEGNALDFMTQRNKREKQPDNL